ncbi:RsmD family RNA methyltransferase [Longimicrobium terrae]|uniref:16S rRNA (Guanine966-N2)-methyltransferase n=1 Tax=Longimicrobium terrae TaxID=1639882 RepID=A0A841H4A7_9BACT|nr:RsmD family RNA methyltransferase [Longimicrobium terrae]MBB4638303.1 16S rRNA (guanine966-N2)-methyltransferase [Longimicrobium terrae]MBB6072629.1 16S rRNA (guanine966-N2)-methyltransferase [Longimicrobium terrae]NNC28592.1 methyltransferase [Longimicrobium terrae]
MRIVKGKLAGRHLTSPKQGRVRPTTENVRDALLSALEPRLKGARVLDLFAGTGALGLEALSRGARFADFVESGPDSLHALKSNVTALRMRDKARIFKKDALPFARALPARKYDIAFADPPYESRMLDRLIEMWMETPFAQLLVVEHAASHELPPGGKRRQMDDTTAVTFYLAPPPPPEEPAPADSDAELDAQAEDVDA